MKLSSVRTLSRSTSLSHVRLKSSEALRNSARLLPIDRASVGNLRGPKNMRAITKMKSSSVLPNESRISANTTKVHLPENLLAQAIGSNQYSFNNVLFDPYCRVATLVSEVLPSNIRIVARRQTKLKAALLYKVYSKIKKPFLTVFSGRLECCKKKTVQNA